MKLKDGTAGIPGIYRLVIDANKPIIYEVGDIVYFLFDEDLGITQSDPAYNSSYIRKVIKEIDTSKLTKLSDILPYLSNIETNVIDSKFIENMKDQNKGILNLDDLVGKYGDYLVTYGYVLNMLKSKFKYPFGDTYLGSEGIPTMSMNEINWTTIKSGYYNIRNSDSIKLLRVSEFHDYSTSGLIKLCEIFGIKSNKLYDYSIGIYDSEKSTPPNFVIIYNANAVYNCITEAYALTEAYQDDLAELESNLLNLIRNI